MKTKEIAAYTGGSLTGDGEIEILRAAALRSAGENEIGFLEKTEDFAETAAACLLVPQNFDRTLNIPLIRVSNPKLAFARLAAVIHAPAKSGAGRHDSSFVSGSAGLGRETYIGAHVSIGDGTVIGEGTQVLSGAKIGDRVRIGANCVIHPNCVLYDDVSIGDNCIIHAGAVIGADGFGFVRDGARGYVKFPQIGTVEIEDDVEIGAGTCVDRGALGETRIGAGTKIDNLVQIAHNVQIGKRVVIASQTGISGSTVIEDDCVIGGQVGFGDHARVLSGAIIGSQAGVLPGKIVRPGVWWGTPVQPLDEYKKQNARVKGLGRLKEQLKKLEARLAELIEKS